jgi:hypothetical protein
MSKFLILLIGINNIFTLSNAQMPCELKGTVVNENNVPLSGVSVLLFPVKKGTVTDAGGGFVFS